VSTHKVVSTVLSRAPLGLAAPRVRVEVHLGAGLPTFTMVGLPEAVVRESKERVRSALVTSGFDFPAGWITVNLSPADLPKEGGRFDLPIAVGILAASGKIPAHALEQREFYGELSLGGELRQTPKLLPALVAGSRSGRELILPFANALEASLVRHAKLKLASHLWQVCAALRDKAVVSALACPADFANLVDLANHTDTSDFFGVAQKPPPDLAEVRGQFAAKRALEIAAAGEHGLLKPLTTGPLPLRMQPARIGPQEDSRHRQLCGNRKAHDGRREGLRCYFDLRCRRFVALGRHALDIAVQLTGVDQDLSARHRNAVRLLLDCVDRGVSRGCLHCVADGVPNLKSMHCDLHCHSSTRLLKLIPTITNTRMAFHSNRVAKLTF
jgi:hypothetical protein